MSNAEYQPKYITALRNQPKTADVAPSDAWVCPYCDHAGRIFQSLDQLLFHARDAHRSILPPGAKTSDFRAKVQQDALATMKALTDRSSGATAGNTSTPDMTALSLEGGKGRQSPNGRKRHADTELQRRGKAVGPMEIYDANQDITHTIPPQPRTSRTAEPRYSDPKSSKGTASPFRVTPEPPSEWSIEAARSHFQTSQSTQSHSPHPQSGHRTAPPPVFNPKTQSVSSPLSVQPRQSGLGDLQKYDPRYPGLLLQPESRPISQEQLASEVKSIYAGLTMVETKCIHVDRAEAAQMQDPHATPKLGSEYWQALIALHRTLLHEHHDFFLASQHPSASPALRRLAAKYSMPARMWKHGIHSFLELLRRRLPDSIDYMLAFIYLAYQMMALLYETVPAFEDTWIECLGDLGRYRMAIEDEDIRARETWAGVARSWYSKAADKNPSVGRLYHHLAILARPNALQQLYYYARSLTCVKPFPSARESILTLLDPILGRPAGAYPQALPIDTYFIQAHGVLFEKLSAEQFEDARINFQSQLDNHIGRVTAKWKEQGVYIAVTNIAGLFDYGSDESVLCMILHLHYQQLSAASRQTSTHSDDEPSPTNAQSAIPLITEAEVPAQLEILSRDPNFSRAYDLAMSTLSLVLRRIGDKNVLPHLHVLLSFFTSFASIKYVAHLIDHAPWSEIVPFLNTLLKTDRPDHTLGIFPTEFNEYTQPLPEDYLIRGQIWSQSYFPGNWFARELGEEERYLELASTIKLRTERIVRLGFHLAEYGRWITYNPQTHTFAVVNSSDSF